MKDLRKKFNIQREESSPTELFMRMKSILSNKVSYKKIILYILFAFLIFIIIFKPEYVATYISNWINKFLEHWQINTK